MNEHPIAAFADQIKPGMRVGSAYAADGLGSWREPVLITQVRIEDQSGVFGGTARTVHLLGVHDDGRPFTYYCGPQLAVHIFDAPIHEVQS